MDKKVMVSFSSTVLRTSGGGEKEYRCTWSIYNTFCFLVVNNMQFGSLLNLSEDLNHINLRVS
jgi:hypothetical protein